MTSQSIDYDALVSEDRVHGRVYLDPNIFEDEIAKIFHRGWVYVGHSGEIPEPGDYRLRKIGRAPVIMVRDDRGEMRLLLNRCRHRAATVCQIEQGNAKFFRCAYHGWTYRNNGELSAVTYQDGYGGSLRKEELGLTNVPRMGTYRGFVFGSLAPDGISLDEHLGAAKDQIDLFVDLSPQGELDVRAGVNKYSYTGNWKLQVENAIDGYHPNLVHQSTFEIIRQADQDRDGCVCGQLDRRDARSRQWSCDARFPSIQSGGGSRTKGSADNLRPRSGI